MSTREAPAANPAVVVAIALIIVLSCIFPTLAVARTVDPPNTLAIRIDAPEADVIQAIQQVTSDQIIHGTYSYEKEKILMGAHAADNSPFFGKWEGEGKAFYKVAENVLAPRYFKESGDIGTITVRYIVQPAGPNSTDIRIDAVFVDARRGVHWSEGGVESAEYGALQQQIRELHALRTKPRALQESSSRAMTFAPAQPRFPKAAAQTTPSGPVSAEQQLQERVNSLRHELERRVKADGTLLKSAPYQSAATLEKLPANSNVLLLILSPYWYGVETEDGHHGWIHQSQLEPLP